MPKTIEEVLRSEGHAPDVLEAAKPFGSDWRRAWLETDNAKFLQSVFLSLCPRFDEKLGEKMQKALGAALEAYGATEETDLDSRHVFCPVEELPKEYRDAQASIMAAIEAGVPSGEIMTSEAAKTVRRYHLQDEIDEPSKSEANPELDKAAADAYRSMIDFDRDLAGRV